MSGPPPLVVGPAAKAYWDRRADRFATSGHGLGAVCSYGMPSFYNRAIDLGQRLALRRWLAVGDGVEVLDVGCGIGRWSRRLARRGARVTGVDLSPVMVAEARRRAREQELEERCEFAVAALEGLELDRTFDLVLGVTVLQHVLDPVALDAAIGRIRAHLRPGGRAVLLEAAPRRVRPRTQSHVFRARPQAEYRRRFARAGLVLESVTGVDPMPFKLWVLPWLRSWPRPVGLVVLAAATALALPVDLALGRRLVDASWHKVFVLRTGPPGAER